MTEDDFYEYPLEDILEYRLPEGAVAYLNQNSWYTCGYHYSRVAIELDLHNEKVEKAIVRILTEDNNKGVLTHELIRGIICSHRREFHELLAKLLVSARLQEGLRQAICENADMGTKEAFFTIFDAVLAHQLIRYSSVKRAIGTWLGILNTETHDLERVSEKSARLAYRYLTDPEAQKEGLQSEDAMALYIALWSISFHNIKNVWAHIVHFAEAGSRHQLLTVGYFIRGIGERVLQHTLAKIVLTKQKPEEEILAVWISSFLPYGSNTVYYDEKTTRKFDIEPWFHSNEEIAEFYEILSRLYLSTVKSKRFSPCVFPWNEELYEKKAVVERLLIPVALSQDKQLIDRSVGLIKESFSYSRRVLLRAMLAAPVGEIQRRAVLEAIADKEDYTRRDATKIAMQLFLTSEEYRFLEGLLRFKGADIRETVMVLLLRQDREALRDCIHRLLKDSKEEVRLGGLDLLSRLQKTGSELLIRFSDTLKAYAQNERMSSKESLLLDTLLLQTESKQKIFFTDADRYSPRDVSLDRYCENDVAWHLDRDYIDRCAAVYRCYFPDASLSDLIDSPKEKKATDGDVGTSAMNNCCESARLAKEDLYALSAFVEANKTASYVTSYGETVLIGNIHYSFHYQDGELPCKELWHTFYESRGMTSERVLRAVILFLALDLQIPFVGRTHALISEAFGCGFEQKVSLPYERVVEEILMMYLNEVPIADKRLLASALSAWLVTCVKDEDVYFYSKEYDSPNYKAKGAHLLGHRQLNCLYQYLQCEDDEILPAVFPLAVSVADRCVSAMPEEARAYCIQTVISNTIFEKSFVSAPSYFFAFVRGIISKPALYEFILRDTVIKNSLYAITTLVSYYYENFSLNRSNGTSGYSSRYQQECFLSSVMESLKEPKNTLAFFEAVEECYRELIPHIVDTECRRGDSCGRYSSAIGKITCVYGVDLFAKILDALGKDTLNRSRYYSYSAVTSSRSQTLSYLLANTHPDKIDTVETLRQALKGKRISKKRLIESAMYTPEWIGLIGEYLEIPSFESIVYYFMAHMNDQFDDRRRAMIARFTPLSEEELNLGAFDLTWFYSTVKLIGEEEFELIYDSAKYIADGAKHTRARKYADAALGKYSVDELETLILEKRNKDYLMAYPLIPILNETDICRRYLFLQRFLKESKKFGSQRIASEGKAYEMAMKNLALSAGYRDTMRLTLRMEAKLLDDKRELLLPQQIEDYMLQLVITDDGTCEIVVTKDGKSLKAFPAKLKKHETVIALTDLKKILSEQYRRTRRMLEEAMENESVFTVAEVTTLMEHPVVAPILSKLLLMTDTYEGFWCKGKLVSSDGREVELDDDALLRIAHPFRLYQRGGWRSYQKYLYDNAIKQPFRQVFRELYVKTEDERECYYSLRYAGNQILPRKTVATLKTRRWVADVENGLQKVYYQENIVARIYALADWFSPADIEAPTLEWVVFSNSKTGENIKISEIPDVIFSEVMRDVDLAVSVAHAGGVDPEASHSTVEMRSAILSFVLPLFGIANVTLQEQYALIDGAMAQYSVHLGSGIVHQIGGSMIPVFPIHSQHRGRIFLPFVDDDPKTAEIISKILLFAEDKKIKDPTILASIVRY